MKNEEVVSMKISKFNLKASAFVYIYSLLTLVLYNALFCKELFGVSKSFVVSSIALIVVFLVLSAVFRIIFFPKITKTFAIFLLFFNTIASYFMITYNISIDYIMLLNIFHTDYNEASALLNIRMLIYFTCLFLVPSFIIYKTNIIYTKDNLKNILKNVLLNLIIVAIILLPISSKADNFYREQKFLRYYLVPTNYIGAVISLIKRVDFSSKELVSIADDIKVEKYWENDKKNLIVLIVGESARAANFSLGSYSRPTNKDLITYQNDFVYFENFYASGTATAVSVPNMLMHYTRREFKPGVELYTDNITNIMEKAGYKTLWRENNTGCENTCNRVETEKPCKKKHCHDEIMLEKLEDKISQINQDTFIVLHQRGSHGPDYYNMYPKEFEIYTPVCKQNILSKCDKESLINAYDNAITYTSYFIKETIRTIDKLKDKYNIMMFYASDHGESLGEKGVYTHSAVYKYAPIEQIHIPALIWMPKSTQNDLSIDVKCLKNLAENKFSHDNIFHTILGFSGAKTSVYKGDLDILSMCRISK